MRTVQAMFKEEGRREFDLSFHILGSVLTVIIALLSIFVNEQCGKLLPECERKN